MPEIRNCVETNDSDWIVFGKGYNKFQAFRGQIENFARAIKGEDKMLVSPEDALASVAVDRKSTRLNSSHIPLSRMPSSA